MTIHEYFGDWCPVVDVEEADRIMRILAKSKHPLCPKLKDVFKAFSLCSFNDLKVVILGERPYSKMVNGSPVATGIAFGNHPDTLESDYSPSLGVLKESVINYSLPHDGIIFDPSLEMWEAQGVLMLNASLSCIVGNACAHASLWRPFIRSFLTKLSAYSSGIVYVLMGKEAEKFKNCINDKFNYVVITNSLSVFATPPSLPPYLWYHVNRILIGLYGFGIKWYDNPY